MQKIFIAGIVFYLLGKNPDCSGNEMFVNCI
jgi:hypothetical protein